MPPNLAGALAHAKAVLVQTHSQDQNAVGLINGSVFQMPSGLEGGSAFVAIVWQSSQINSRRIGMVQEIRSFRVTLTARLALRPLYAQFIAQNLPHSDLETLIAVGTDQLEACASIGSIG